MYFIYRDDYYNRIQKIRTSRRSSSPSRGTARSARCAWRGCRSIPVSETNCGSSSRRSGRQKKLFQFYRGASGGFLSVRLLLADQAVQLSEMFLLLALFCLEEKIDLTDDITGHSAADVVF